MKANAFFSMDATAACKPSSRRNARGFLTRGISPAGATFAKRYRWNEKLKFPDGLAVDQRAHGASGEFTTMKRRIAAATFRRIAIHFPFE